VSSATGGTFARVSGEIVAGKRTVIAREGHEDFELPQGHEISVGRDQQGDVENATLRWGDHRSVFFASMEERDDEVVVRLGDLFGSTGYGTSSEGEAFPEALPYPFPND
jgi:hypothetical protein